MKLRAICLVPFLVLLSGCMTMFDRYTEPEQSEHTAKVRFIASSNLRGIVQVYRVLADGPCGKYGSDTSSNMRFIGVLHGPTVERKTLGLPLAEDLLEKDFTEIVVSTKSPFIFDMMNVTSNLGGISVSAGTYKHVMSYCNLTSQFTPEAGHIYEATILNHTNGCLVSLMEIEKSPNNSYIRVPVRTWHKSPTQCRWN